MIGVHGLRLILGNYRLEAAEFTIPSGAYGVLMGRTGCGKTSILEAICGLRPVAAGRVLIAGRDVTKLKPAERLVAYVPQDLALFPTIDVAGHLAFALAIRGRPAAEIAARTQELAGLLGIGHLLGRSIHHLSGGERQRVALGRALAVTPTALLLDEPLSALDEDTHDELCRLLKAVQRMTKVTVLHVTHSRREAERLADVRLRLSDGRVVADA